MMMKMIILGLMTIVIMIFDYTALSLFETSPGDNSDGGDDNDIHTSI